jgi:four helix bundle protein
VKTHRDLDVWKEGIDLAISIYKVAEKFPKEEKYSLVDQVKRSAVSIPSNIAEGAARNSSKEFMQYLHIALGSAAELETQLIISEKLGFIDEKNIFAELEKVKSKLLGLIKFVRRDEANVRRLTSYVLR